MEKKVFRVGSVGIGGISRGVHLPGIEKSPDLRLTAVCDLKPERMAYAREKYGVPEANCFSDYRDLVNCPDVDVVDISTSNNAHFAVAKAAIEAGKPYCIEKPVTLTAEEADILARMTAERGLPSMVCFSYRFKAAARYARELVEQGMLGEIYHVYMQYLQAGGGPSYDLPRSWRYQKALTGWATSAAMRSIWWALSPARATDGPWATRTPLCTAAVSRRARVWARWMWTTSATT